MNMALLSTLLTIVAALAGLVIFVMVMAIIVDITRWILNPEENSGLQE